MYFNMWQAVWFETLVAIMSIHILLIYVFSGILRRKLTLALIAILYVPNVAVSFLSSNTTAWQVSSALVTWLPLFLPLVTVSGIRKLTVLYTTLLYVGFSAFIVFIFNSIAQLLGYALIGRFVADVLANILLFVVCLLIGKRKILPNIYSDFAVLTTRFKALILISILVGTAFANFFAALFSAIPRTSLASATEFLAYVLSALVFVMCPIMTAGSVANAYNKRMLTVADKQIKAQAAHYALVTKITSDLRTFKHDFNNIRIGIDSCLAVGDIEGARQLLVEGDKPLRGGLILHDTGNRIADALLYEKHAIALEIGATIDLDGVIPDNCIDPADLCTMLGNALDNALEACATLPESIKRQVGVSSTFANGFLFLRVQNPVVENVRIVNNIIATTKADAAAHGVGLGSIQNAARKYGGVTHLACENCMFTIEVDLDLNDR